MAKNDIKRELYERFEAKPITEMAKTIRWSYFRKILMMPSESPPQRALEFAIVGSKKLVSRRGRHQTNLFEALKCETKNKLESKLDSKTSLEKIRGIARNEKIWNEPKKVKAPNIETSNKRRLRSHRRT